MTLQGAADKIKVANSEQPRRTGPEIIGIPANATRNDSWISWICLFV
jgi:hypothetical protein